MFIICLPCVWSCANQMWTKEVMAWNAALLDWQSRMNAELLVRKGMLVQTRSHASVWYDRNGNVTSLHCAHRMQPQSTCGHAERMADECLLFWLLAVSMCVCAQHRTVQRWLAVAMTPQEVQRP